MDAGTWRGVFTVVMLLMFVAICVWAFSSRRKRDFDDAAQLPLLSDDGEIPDTERRSKDRD